MKREPVWHFLQSAATVALLFVLAAGSLGGFLHVLRFLVLRGHAFAPFP